MKRIFSIVALATLMLTLGATLLPANALSTMDLYAGKNTIVGLVVVSNDATNLYVQYVTTGGWTIEETHLAVATDLSDIPQNHGGPIVGKFQYKETSAPGTTEVTYTIPLSSFGAGQTLFIAAHAVVVNGRASETAWAGCLVSNPFPGANWAMYFTYDVT